MKLKDFFDLCANDYIIYIYVSENRLVYKGLLDKFDKEERSHSIQSELMSVTKSVLLPQLTEANVINPSVSTTSYSRINVSSNISK